LEGLNEIAALDFFAQAIGKPGMDALQAEVALVGVVADRGLEQ
jgi:hypothetical protein